VVEKGTKLVILSPPAPACRQAGQAGEAKNLSGLHRKKQRDSSSPARWLAGFAPQNDMRGEFFFATCEACRVSTAIGGALIAPCNSQKNQRTEVPPKLLLTLIAD
jgi:hypothetical protein